MLQINQTFAKIGIETTPGKLDIQTKSAKLELKQNHAKVSLRTELPKVQIDQTQCFAETGRKHILEFASEAAQRGHRQAMEYIGKKASDGRRLSAIEKGGNPSVNIALRDAYPERHFGLGFIPKSRPKITVTGEVKVDADISKEAENSAVEGTYTPHNTNIHFQRGDINTYLRQKASISFSYKGENVDRRG